MSKIGKCDVCGIIFPDVGDLESEVRVRNHMKTPHVVPCAKFDKKFVSTAHQVFHEYFSHEPLCPHCDKLCEGRCSSLHSVAAEREGRKIMERMTRGSNKAVDDTESSVRELIEAIAGGKGDLVRNYANYLDVGYVDSESIMWCTLMYYPSPEMPKKMMSDYTYWYTYLVLVHGST